MADRKGKQMEHDKLTIYSYAKVWKVEKKIYNIGNIVFPVPIELWGGVYLISSAFCSYLLQKLFPVITVVPVVIRLGLLPYGIMYLMRKMKVDGKNPVKYLAGGIIYLAHDRYRYLERFMQHQGRTERLVLDWNCSRAYRKPLKEKRVRRKESTNV